MTDALYTHHCMGRAARDNGGPYLRPKMAYSLDQPNCGAVSAIKRSIVPIAGPLFDPFARDKSLAHSVLILKTKRANYI